MPLSVSFDKDLYLGEGQYLISDQCNKHNNKIRFFYYLLNSLIYRSQIVNIWAVFPSHSTHLLLLDKIDILVYSHVSTIHSKDLNIILYTDTRARPIIGFAD